MVEGQVVGEIGHGLALLIGAHSTDDERALSFCADKCVHLRIFSDEAGRMNRSLLDIGGSILAVSQFTLYGDCRKGRRPSFVEAAPAELAQGLYARFVQLLEGHGVSVSEGIFGAHMKVQLVNDGPVTILVENPPTPI